MPTGQDRKPEGKAVEQNPKQGSLHEKGEADQKNKPKYFKKNKQLSFTEGNVSTKRRGRNKIPLGYL